MAFSSEPSPFADRPTRIRHVVVFLTTMVAVLLYLDRICLSFVERYVKDDLRLTDFQMGVLLGAFFWAYAVAQVPAGFLSDRYGARLTLALYVAIWSAFTGLMGLAYGLIILIVLRLGCGLSEAGAYPACASLLSRWVPASNRGLASGIVSIGGRAGGALAPVLTAYLVVAFVPLATPVQLTRSDLMDPTQLCRLMVKPEKSTRTGTRHQLLISQIVAGQAAAIPAPQGPFLPQASVALNLVSLDASTMPSRLAVAIFQRLPPAAAELVRKVGSDPNSPPLDAAQEQVLLAGLNQVLDSPDLIENVPTDVELPAEVSAGLKEKAARKGDESTAQLERRNRLLLEVAFPKALAKLYGKGWRPVMVIYGVFGVVVAGIFWLFFRDRPRQHPKCNAAEIALIEGNRPPAATGKTSGALPLGSLMRDRNLWLISLSAFGTNFGWVFLLTWFPRLLQEVHAVAVVRRGWMASLPLLVGIGGLYLGGWLTDRLTLRLGSYRGRCVLLAVSRFLAMAAFLSCLVLQSPWTVTAAMALVSLGTDLGTPAFWAYSQDVGGRHVGSVLGWLNMWGNIGAALSPTVFGLLVQIERWDLMFLISAAAFLISGLAALGVDASRPIAFPEDKPTVPSQVPAPTVLLEDPTEAALGDTGIKSADPPGFAETGR